MSKSDNTHIREEFCSADAVDSYSKGKYFAIDELQRQVIIDTLKDLGKLNGKTKLGTLLDVGCGSGIVTSLVAKNFNRAVGVDVSANQIKKAKEHGHSEHIEFKVGDAENLPVADASVDVIINVFAIHYLDLDKFLAECRRVLKPGGVVIIYCEFVTALKSLEDDKLPHIVDEMKELRNSVIDIDKASSHRDVLLLDDFCALHDLIDWPWSHKRRIIRKGFTSAKLSEVLGYFLSVPLYASMGTTASNPFVRAFQKVQDAWKLNGMNMEVQAAWDAAVLVLN